MRRCEGNVSQLSLVVMRTHVYMMCRQKNEGNGNDTARGENQQR